MTDATLTTIDRALLVTATGGQAAPQQGQQEQQGSRSWGQIGREYAAACVQGAGQSLMFGGRPRSAREAAGTAAFGCAVGVGQKAVDDVSQAIAGGR
jgi:hypothetical protein